MTVPVDDGQAAAVDGDRVTLVNLVEDRAGTDPEAVTVTLGDAAELLHDSGEHVSISQVRRGLAPGGDRGAARDATPVPSLPSGL